MTAPGSPAGSVDGTDTAKLHAGSSSSVLPPLTNAQAIQQFGSCLSIFESTEILSYPTVFYVGQDCTEKIAAPTGEANDGYDDEEGKYKTRLHDHIAYQYDTIKILGTGAFGQVVEALDRATGKAVAIKLIRNRRKVAQQAQQEIEMLRLIAERDPQDRFGMVRMIACFEFRRHTCIVYELLGQSLYDYMEGKNFYPMPLSAVKTIAASVLVSLTFLRREGVIHADLKPENVLLGSSNAFSVKVIDFGSACFTGGASFQYIQSRYYRAPEVVLGLPYDSPIDLWSYACILCELATGNPIFSGTSAWDQLACIVEYLGPPPEDMLNKSRQRRRFYRDGNTLTLAPNAHGVPRVANSKSLAKFLGLEPDDLFIDFLQQFLRWNPADRVAPRAAMRHAWISSAFVFNPARAPRTPVARAQQPSDAPQEAEELKPLEVQVQMNGSRASEPQALPALISRKAVPHVMRDHQSSAPPAAEPEAERPANHEAPVVVQMRREATGVRAAAPSAAAPAAASALHVRRPQEPRSEEPRISQSADASYSFHRVLALGSIQTNSDAGNDSEPPPDAALPPPLPERSGAAPPRGARAEADHLSVSSPIVLEGTAAEDARGSPTRRSRSIADMRPQRPRQVGPRQLQPSALRTLLHPSLPPEESSAAGASTSDGKTPMRRFSTSTSTDVSRGNESGPNSRRHSTARSARRSQRWRQNEAAIVPDTPASVTTEEVHLPPILPSKALGRRRS